MDNAGWAGQHQHGYEGLQALALLPQRDVNHMKQ